MTGVQTGPAVETEAPATTDVQAPGSR